MEGWNIGLREYSNNIFEFWLFVIPVKTGIHEYFE